MFKLKLQEHLLQFCLLAACLKTALACHGKLLAAGITEEEKEIILQEHNKLRQMVATGRFPGQPAAENMREIVWDDELALRAQQWAENCQFRHDPYRTINRFTMGQNLAIIWSTVPLDPDDGDFPSRIQSWFNEVQKYSFGDAWSIKTGHYSQLVWGETSLVGCGYSEYKDKYKYNKLYVCNYGPGGNVVGYKPYEVGKPSCASYGMKPSSRYHGLCAAPQESTGLSTNAIETYDYNNNNNNNKVTYSYNTYRNYNTRQQTNQYTSTTTNTNTNTNIQDNNNNNNNNYENNENTFSNIYEHHQQAASTSTSTSYNIQQTQQQTASAATATAASASATQKISSVHSGFSFGSRTSGGSQSFTTEAPQQQQQLYNKYRHKLESYKPSPEEFKRAVLKHTILRTSVAQELQQEQQQQQQQHQQQQQQQQPLLQQQSENQPENESGTTAPPAKRGWSLLTWRG